MMKRRNTRGHVAEAFFTCRRKVRVEEQPEELAGRRISHKLGTRHAQRSVCLAGTCAKISTSKADKITKRVIERTALPKCSYRLPVQKMICHTTIYRRGDGWELRYY